MSLRLLLRRETCFAGRLLSESEFECSFGFEFVFVFFFFFALSFFFPLLFSSCAQTTQSPKHTTIACRNGQSKSHDAFVSSRLCAASTSSSSSSSAAAAAATSPRNHLHFYLYLSVARLLFWPARRAASSIGGSFEFETDSPLTCGKSESRRRRLFFPLVLRGSQISIN